MNCTKCNFHLDNDSKFCPNCGIRLDNNSVESFDNSVDNNNLENNSFINNSFDNSSHSNKEEKDFGLYSLICGICSVIFMGILGIGLGVASIFLRKKEHQKSKKGKIGFILGIIGIVISILYLFSITSLFKTFFDIINSENVPNYSEQYNNNENSNSNSNENNNSNLNSSNNNPTDENQTSTVKGNYSRDVFSGNIFEYKTLTDTAIFTFNKNSTFEVKYIDGNTYRGTYEIYNGLFISLKTNDIRIDTSINNNEILANNIQNVANSMIEKDILNTYLLWIKTDDNILQPFVVLYNQETNSADIVNVYAQTQGKLTLK